MELLWGFVLWVVPIGLSLLLYWRADKALKRQMARLERLITIVSKVVTDPEGTSIRYDPTTGEPLGNTYQVRASATQRASGSVRLGVTRPDEPPEANE